MPTDALKSFSVKSFFENKECDSSYNFSNKLIIFCSLLCLISPVNDKKRMNDFEHKTGDIISNFREEKEFLAMLKFVFSQQGKNLLAPVYGKSVNSITNICDFAFSIDENKIVNIDLGLDIPHFHYRINRLIDTFSMPTYLIVSSDQCLLPPFSRTFLNNCKLIEKDVKSCYVEDRNQFDTITLKKLGLKENDKVNLDEFYSFLQSEDYDLAQQLMPTQEELNLIYDQAFKLCQKNDYTGALKEFKKALGGFRNTKGEIAIECGKCYSGIVTCYRALHLPPAEALEYAEKAIKIFSAANQDLTKIIGKYKSFLENGNFSAEELHTRGVGLFNKKEYTAAIELFLIAADKFSNNNNKNNNQENAAIAYSCLGSCYREINKLEEALNYIEKALNLRQAEEPKNKKAINTLEIKLNQIKEKMKAVAVTHDNSKSQNLS
jgi:tetratricopeptide (TPR) repeat protein